MPASDYESRTGFEEGIKRAAAGTFFSIAGGAVILVQAVLILLNGEISLFNSFWGQPQPTAFGLGLGLIGFFGIVAGISILAAAYLIFSPGFEIIGGLVVLIFSIVSIVVGGGWLLGLALGMLGGILGLFKK